MICGCPTLIGLQGAPISSKGETRCAHQVVLPSLECLTSDRCSQWEDKFPDGHHTVRFLEASVYMYRIPSFRHGIFVFGENPPGEIRGSARVPLSDVRWFGSADA